MKLFFGKISQENGEQIEHNFYAAGPKDAPWYNGLEVGDYVFPIFEGKISKLWKVKGFGQTPIFNKKFGNTSALFDVIKQYERPINLATQFCCCRFFDIDLNLVNKSTKSTAKEYKGFFEISTTENCPLPEKIDLLDSRKIIFDLEEEMYQQFSDDDIKIVVNSNNKYWIKDITIQKNGHFQRYQPLWNLYDSKNPQKYSLDELLNFSVTDEASKKNKYLNALISDLKDQGYFIASNPIALYDNVIVGRKRFLKKKDKQEEIEVEEHDKEADDLTDKDKFEKYLRYVDLLEFNPNLILYGPPGTGKTYTAQRIVEAFEYKLTNNPSIKFDNIKNEGRVEFVTFHQSYSYEEFIEGIRPVIYTDDEESVVKEIKYEIKPGILRNIANNASLDILREDKKNQPLQDLRKDSNVYKISLGRRNSDDHIYQQCKKSEIIAIGWLEDTDLKDKDYNYFYEKLKKAGYESSNPTNDASSLNTFINVVKEGDIVFIYEGPYTIRDIGIITSGYIYNPERDEYPHTRKVKWIKEFKKPLDISTYNGNTRLTMKTIYPLNRIAFDDLVSIIGTEEVKLTKEKILKPFFIIIDEINRGNISKIFGELITLIEDDKRGVLQLTLPYSQKPFVIPSNLYFIGTMNTADRSIAVLDTALRRRFVFEELVPNSEIIESAENPIIDAKIDLAILMNSLNKKIEKLYDRDHRIGHSYFLDAVNMKKLRQVWYCQIIPLLLEYFYNDSNKIMKILGPEFYDEKTQTVNFNLTNEEFTNAILNICNG